MIDLSPYQLDIVVNILKKHVPECEVRVFGSRYKWMAKDYSDLDLAIVGKEKLDKKTIYALQEAFSNSELPIKVDVLDFNAISEEFRKIIQQGYEVIEKKKKLLPEGWEVKKLGDIVDFNPTEKLPKGSIAKKIAMEQLQPYNRKISNYEITNFNGGSKFKNKDTLVARITPCLENGKTAYVDILEDNEIGFGSTEFIVLREKEYLSDSEFIYYLSISPDFRDKAIKSMTGTSGRQRVQTDELINHEMAIPPFNEQKEIAAILSNLDEKININNQINNKLEEIAQTLFARWLIDFNFPNENGAPYKDSGGAMVDSELGKIPKDWLVINLSDYLDFIRGIEPGSKEYVSNKMSDEYIQFIRVSDLQTIGSTYIHKNLAKDKIVYENDVLMSFDGTIGRIKIGLQGVYSSGIRKIIDNGLNKDDVIFSNQFIYFLMQTDSIQNIITSNAIGTTILHAGNTIKLLKIAINNEIMDLFSEVIYPIYQKLINNSKEIKLLSQIRDSLLPKLMSGEIDVCHSREISCHSSAGGNPEK